MAKALSKRNISLDPDNCTPQLTEEESLRREGRTGRGPQKVQEMPTRLALEGGGLAAKAAEWKETAQETVQDLKERSEETLSKVRQSTAAAYEESKATARDIYENVQQTSGEVARRVRVRTRYILDEYPVQVIAGMAGVAFLVGVLLRIWRSNRYE